MTFPSQAAFEMAGERRGIGRGRLTHVPKEWPGCMLCFGLAAAWKGGAAALSGGAGWGGIGPQGMEEGMAAGAWGPSPTCCSLGRARRSHRPVNREADRLLIFALGDDDVKARRQQEIVQRGDTAHPALFAQA